MLEYLDTVTLPDLTSEEVKAISDAGSQLQSRQFVRSYGSLPTRTTATEMISFTAPLHEGVMHYTPEGECKV